MKDENGRVIRSPYDADKHPGLGYKFALLGCNKTQMADMLDISLSTFKKWMNDYPEFKESVNEGRGLADAEIATSMYQAGRGYTVKETKVLVVNGQVEKHEIDKHYPPDMKAIAMWLRSRQPEKWREVIEHKIQDNDELVSEMEQAIRRVADLYPSK